VAPPSRACRGGSRFIEWRCAFVARLGQIAEETARARNQTVRQSSLDVRDPVTALILLSLRITLALW